MLRKAIRDNFWPILIIFLLPLIFLYQVLIHPGNVLSPAADILGAYSLWRNFLVQHVIDFKTIPLWNPYEYSGAPFIANVSSGIGYPFTLLFFLFPVDLVFGYAFILDFILLGFFTFIFARSIKIGKAGALVASIVLTFSGTVFLTVYPGHLIILDTFLWFPLLLYFFEKGLQNKKIIYGFLSSIPISLMLLSGIPQIALYAFFFAFIYIILRILLDGNVRKTFKFSAFMFVSPLIIGALISSVQILPTLEFLQSSARGGGVDYLFASSFSLPPKQMIAFVLPFFFGSPLDNSFWGIGNFWGICGYLGTIGLVFAGLSLFIKKNIYIKIFFVLAVFSVSYALGKYFIIFPLFYKFIPLFNLFRVPARMLFFYTFSVAILAGIGFDFFISKGKEIVNQNFARKLRITILVISGILMAISIIIKLVNFDIIFDKFILRNKYGLDFNHTILYNHVIYSLLIFSIFFFAFSFLLFVYPKYLRKKFAIPAIIALIIIELFIFDSQFVGTTDPKTYYKIPDEIKYIQRDKSVFRIYDWNANIFYLAERVGIENVIGLDPTDLGYYKKFFWNLGPHEDNASDVFIQIRSLQNLNILRLLNVKYLLSKNEIKNESFNLVYKKNFYVYQLLGTLPRAYLIDEENWKMLNSTQYTLPKKIMPVEENRINANELSLNVVLNSPERLILSEIWYPGWKAFDNGKQISIEEIYIFRSVKLEAGRHNIRFEYKSISFEMGKWMSFITLIILTVIIFVLKFHSQRFGRSSLTKKEYKK